MQWEEGGCVFAWYVLVCKWYLKGKFFLNKYEIKQGYIFFKGSNFIPQHRQVQFFCTKFFLKMLK